MKSEHPEKQNSKSENSELSDDSKSKDNQPSKEEGGGEPSSAGLTANIESIANELSESMPEVQAHAIEQEIISENEKLAQYSHLKDTDGNSFDPTIHKTNKAGEPTLSTKGKLIKKPGRKPNVGTAPKSQTSSVVGGAQGASIESDAHARMQARASGTMAANLVLQIGIVAGGEEWHPRRDEQSGLDEKMMLENAFADYFEATGKTDIPPGMALTVAIGAYALPRFTMPKTQSRLDKLKKGIKQWWINRKLKKHGFKAEAVRNNEDKQNDDSKATIAA